jgi:transcriptional regulator of acetoin/glycerol metabolism
MVLMSGDNCTVRGAEHYFQVNQGMHCAAAPIRDARGELAAVLDLSCEGREFQFDAAALACLYASAIENRLLIRQSRPFVLLRFQADPQLLFTPMEGLAAIDEAGQVLWTNAAGRSLLQAPQSPQAQGSCVCCEQCFGLRLDQLVAAARSGQWLWHGLPNGLRLCLLAQTDAAAARPLVSLAVPADAEPASAPAVPEGAAQPGLRRANQQLIEQTLAACSGNVSRAARRLGVSRGLIYRHMKQPADAG